MAGSQKLRCRFSAIDIDRGVHTMRDFFVKYLSSFTIYRRMNFTVPQMQHAALVTNESSRRQAGTKLVERNLSDAIE